MAYTAIASDDLGFVFPTSFGSTFTMGIWCDNDFVAEDGLLFLASAGDSLTGEFVTKVAGTVTGGVGTYAGFSLPKTTLARPNTIRYYARIFNSHGGPTQYFPFSNMHLRESLGDSITFLAWWVDNQQRIRRQLDTVPSTDEMNTAIAAAGSSGAWISEVPSGTVDGVNGTFTLSSTPVIGSQLFFLNGRLLPAENLGAGTESYTILGAVITCYLPPQLGDKLFAVYRALPGVAGSATGTAGGLGTLPVGASVTIANPSVATNSAIDCIPTTSSISGRLHVFNRVAGASFDVLSGNGADSGVFRYIIYL